MVIGYFGKKDTFIQNRKKLGALGFDYNLRKNWGH